MPAILVTALYLATNTPTLDLPSFLGIPSLPINLGTIGAVLYSFLYILMEPVAGLGITPLIIGSVAYLNHLRDIHGSVVNHWSIAVHIVSWLAQFIGHGKFEGRAPALVDNLVQALFLAPFFVWFEILFYFGYRPELKARVQKQIQEEVRRFRSSKKKDHVNGNGGLKHLNNGATKNE